ncbi:hypothetical protein ACIA8K_30075 [Catenuloplanes sp. NPDC051500]|uniref:hypothetical protein n=1 Tax=Catenuloplanes sp. NPDC051500 TaxID=3363959 RepID=UPI00379D5265
MKISEIVTTARDTMTVRRVFGEPVERDGVTLIPAALIGGGLGAGSGRRGLDGDRKGDEEGDGAGFGLGAVPIGAYSIRDGRVRWHPAVNVNLLIIATAWVTVTWLASRHRTRRGR